METFGSFLRQLRQERRLTLGQLSLQAGLNKATLSRWEAGTYHPRIPELLRVLDALRAAPLVRAKCLRLLDAPRALHAARCDSSAPLRLSRGDLLYGLRQRAGRTQAEAARAAHISRSLYSQWENDEGQPDMGQLHAVGFALGASLEETAALSSVALSHTPIEKSRDVLLLQYAEVMGWEEGVTPESYKLYQLSLLANFGRLFKAGEADLADIALIVGDFGDDAEGRHGDTALANTYYCRALHLAAQSHAPLHFHLIGAIKSLLLSASNPAPLAQRVQAALDWQPRFQDKAGQAYLLAFIAGATALEAPEQALRLADTYCALVADDPAEYPCRLRDRGNLLLKCGRPAESVAFIADLVPQDGFRAGLKQLDMARGLAALGSVGEARACVAEGKRLFSATEYAAVNNMVTTLEHAVA